jgi:hypothetical protein
MSRHLIVPLIALLVTIAGLLGCGAWNRGEARQRITLTERELGLPWPWQNAADDDDEPLRLSIEWQRRDTPLDERTWLTEDKLREIGFNVAIPAGAPEAERHYEHLLPKIAWVVLEFDGPAWQEIDRRRRLRESDAQVRAAIGASRLVPIDAGPDRETLTRRHANSPTLIVPAMFRVAYLDPKTAGGPLVYGHLMTLVTRQVTVPRRSIQALADLRNRAADPASTPPAPRFEVDLAVGRLGFPWVVDVRRTR